MPIYGLLCDCCGEASEHIMGSNEMCREMKCPACAEPLTREKNRDPNDWLTIGIQGDTCANCVDYTGYDEGLEANVRSRTHRKDIMKAKGLSEYVPNKRTSDMLGEMRHIRRNAPPKDPEAIKAMRQVAVDADRKRKREVINAKLTAAVRDLKA